MAAYGTSLPTGLPRASLSDFVSTCQEDVIIPSSLYYFYQEAGFGLMKILTKVWWAELGCPHPQVKVHWNPAQEPPKNWIENHFKLWINVLVHEAAEETHMFCNGSHLHCDPAVNVCTCSEHGLSQSEERSDTQSSDTLWPCTADWGVDQTVPPQSPPYAACICAERDYSRSVLACVYVLKYRKSLEHGNTGDITYVCRSTGSQAQ